MKTTLELMQTNLRTIRLLLGYSTQELANYLGVTRQTVNNLESGKTPLSDTQVTALFAIIDKRLPRESSEYEAIWRLINEPSSQKTSSFSLPTRPLLETWLDCLGITTKETGDSMYTKLSETVLFAFYDFLMAPESLDIMRALIPYLLKNNNRLIIPKTHVIELYKTYQGSEIGPSLHAKNVIACLVQWNSDDIVQIRGRDGDVFKDDTELIGYIVERYGDEFPISILKRDPCDLHLSPAVADRSTVYYLQHGVLNEYVNLSSEDFLKLLENAVEN